MSEPAESFGYADPREPPSPHARFPWVQAAFCAGCVGMAAWLCLTNSFAWKVPPDTLTREARSLSSNGSRWNQACVRIEGTVIASISRTPRSAGESSAGALLWVGDPAPDCRFPDSPRARGRAVCILVDKQVRPGVGGTWVGRVVSLSSPSRETVVDTAASRFTPESVAGLVVGAMGVFIFALHLRRWLVERRAPVPLPVSQPVAPGGPSGDDTA